MDSNEGEKDIGMNGSNGILCFSKMEKSIYKITKEENINYHNVEVDAVEGV